MPPWKAFRAKLKCLARLQAQRCPGHSDAARRGVAAPPSAGRARAPASSGTVGTRAGGSASPGGSHPICPLTSLLGPREVELQAGTSISASVK